MFKLESYITPILLSYVDKYIKNFKPEDSQLSLWGGEVSLHNLDLRLEVLEEELQLPFTFVSGHIHELIIHVPWTKLYSEPICITINTIECILKLRGEDSTATTDGGGNGNGTKERRRRPNKPPDAPAPPGYVQTIINKIVSNITINCCNLIVKYVEEDIVMSMNVKNLIFQSANDKWEPEFSDFLSSNLMLRKIIKLSDVTICLDKRNASGKIDSYQEPVLYRCSLMMRWLRCYNSASAHRANVSRLDVQCHKMTFNISELQVPMMMRLMLLARALQNREVGQRSIEAEHNVEMEEGDESSGENPDQESWTGWAWNLVPALPSWSEDWAGDESEEKGFTFQSGMYIDDLAFNLRVGETGSNDGNAWKNKVEPFLTLSLKGCMLDYTCHNNVWANCQLGISSIQLEAVGPCSCGVNEAALEKCVPYFESGSYQDSYLSESLFSPNAVENCGEKRKYNFSWDIHQNVFSESSLLEKTPALAIDYLYMVELTEECNLEKLLELNGDLEYSDLPEHALCRTVMGPFVLRVNSGLLHRSDKVRQAAALYDYQPYSTPPPEDRRESLPAVTTEEYDSLEENIPLRTYQYTVFQPKIEFYLADHPTLPGPSRRKISVTQPDCSSHLKGSCLSVDCQCVDARFISPMYPRRLVRSACLLPTLPQHMFHACHSHTIGRILGLTGKLCFSHQPECQVFSVNNLLYKQKELFLPHLWEGSDLLHEERSLEAEKGTVSITKPQMMLVLQITTSLVENKAPSAVVCDAFIDGRVLEVVLKNISWQNGLTKLTRFDSLTIAGVDAVLIAGANVDTDMLAKSKALIFSSSVDEKGEQETSSQPFMKACIQWPQHIAQQSHAPLLVITIQEAFFNVDPLLYAWLLVNPSTISLNSNNTNTRTAFAASDINTQSGRSGHRKISDVSGSHISHERSRRSQTPMSVHSSDKDKETLPPPLVTQHSVLSMDQNTKANPTSDQWEFSKWLVQWFPIWQGLVVSIDVAHWQVHLPILSLAKPDTPEQETVAAVDRVCIRLPVVQISSATPSHRHSQPLLPTPTKLPIHLPSSTWVEGGSNFPWNVSLSELSIWTLSNGEHKYLLKPVTTKCTIGLSTRFANSNKDSITSLGLCIHNDTGALHISVNQAQAKILSNVLLNVMVVTRLMFSQHYTPGSVGASTIPAAPPSPTTISESASVSEPRNVLKTTLCEPIQIAEETVKLSVWMQWTLARMSVNLYQQCESPTRKQKRTKLSVEIEDLMTALDFQQIYSKLKLKVASANVHHFVRYEGDKGWQLSPYQGLVMCGYEEIAPPSSGQVQTDDGCGLLTATLTRAKCRNVHSRWGAPVGSGSSSKRYADMKVPGHPDPPAACFITEILVKLQPLDFLLCVETLAELSTILQPFTVLLGEYKNGPSQNVKIPTAPVPGVPVVSSATLPLLYLDLQAVRVLMPISKKYGFHDTLIVQMDSFTLSPHAENPLWRTPIRPDVFHMAEQARILTIPGSEVEDRQYELNVTGLAMSTGQWNNIESCRKLPTNTPGSSLRTMSENPALVWNSLGSNTQNDASEIVGSPKPQLMTVLAPLKICMIGAPAIVYRGKVLVCGHALEINATSEIDLKLTTNQICLMVSLLTELQTVLLNFLSKPDGPKPVKPSFVVELAEKQYYNSLLSMPDLPATEQVHLDSGIDTAEISSIETLHSSRMRGGRRVSRSPRYIESVHGLSVHSAPSAQAWTFKQDRDSNAQTKSAASEQPADFLACSRSSLQRERASDSLPSREKNLDSPFDLLITAGKISLMIHEDSRSSTATEFDENGNVHKPLFRILVTQPHMFYSQFSRSCSMQISMYNALVQLGAPHQIVDFQPAFNETDFPIILFESRKGDVDPQTGVPPALFTAHWNFTPAKPAQVSVELARPAKCTINTVNLEFIQHILNVISTCVSRPNNTDNTVFETNQSKKSLDQFLDSLSGIGVVSFKSVQLVVALQAENRDHINSVVEMSVVSLEGDLMCTSRTRWGCNVSAVERIACHLSCKGLSLVSSHRLARQILLEPCNMNLRLELLWPSWLPRSLHNSLPHTQLTVQSDYVAVTISPDHVQCLNNLYDAYRPFLNTSAEVNQTDVTPLQHMSPSTPTSEVYSSETDFVDTEQHYTDDLRAGAFQFMDATNTLERDQIPLPYQCVFWESSPPAIAWRYPQPRSLTNVHIFPVPFKSAPDAEVGKEDAPVVVCSLQYWSECRGSYQHYATFLLSETNESKVELPSSSVSAVSAVWRVLLAGTQDMHGHGLTMSDSDSSESLTTDVPVVSPRALAACMRIDSFFSASLAPNLQASFNMTVFQVSLMNQLSDSQLHPMPPGLEDYLLDGKVPRNHSFMWWSLNHFALFYSAWPEGRITADLNSLSDLDVLDYSTLTQQKVIEPFLSCLRMSLSPEKSVDVSFVSRPIALKLASAITHTIAASTKLWHQELVQENIKPVQVFVSQYILCNDTVLPIVIGQIETDEQILLSSRQCHMYSWRSLSKKPSLHLSVMDPSILKLGKEVWTSPFSIDSLGMQVCKLCLDSSKEIFLFVNVTALSATQKRVTLTGQLQILNQVGLTLDLRMMRPASDWSLEACNCLVPLQPDCLAPSLLLDRHANDPQLAIRLRLKGQLEASLWTGDIPLKENPKSNQPWLVKVPLQDKHQFVCVWCRVIRENVQGHKRILVLLSPMYAVRSFLPTAMPVAVTNDQNSDSRVSVEVQGRGQVTLLHLPAALKENTHQLNLRNSANVKVFPFGYSCIDPKRIFPSLDQVGIDTVIESSLKAKNSTWPLPNDELSSIQWIGVEIENSYVQAVYCPLSQYSGTLVLELHPWALLLNTLGCSICIEQSGEQVISLPSKGIVAPPKLEGTFHLGLKFNNSAEWSFSDALQLARPDWGKSFYMPRISGLVPIDGHVQISVKCEPSAISLLTLRSQVHSEIRVVDICSSFVVSNSTSIPIQVTAIAMRHTDLNRRVVVPLKDSLETQNATITAQPNSRHKGYPLEKWLHVTSCEADLVPYICVSVEESKELSCPLRISNFPLRRRFVVPSEEKTNEGNTIQTYKSFVMSVVETNGQTFVDIDHEPYPQVILHNDCDFRILCAEAIPQGKNSNADYKIIPDAAPWDWYCAVDPHCSVGYNTPSADDVFPQIVTAPQNFFIALAVDVGSLNQVSAISWSPTVQLSGKQEQFISIPGRGDVKVHTWMEGYSTHVSIEAVSRVEICARDIRSRLSAVPEFPEPLATLDEVSSLETPGSCASTDSEVTQPQEEEVVLSHNIAYKKQSFTKVAVFIQSFTWTLTAPVSMSDEIEISALTLDQIAVTTSPILPISSRSSPPELSLQVTLGDFQLDNQLFERGGFDFPVVLMGQQDKDHIRKIPSMPVNLGTPASQLVNKYSPQALLAVNITLESSLNGTIPKTVHVSIGPITAYVEDKYVMDLKKHLFALLSPLLTMWAPSDDSESTKCNTSTAPWIPAPLPVCLELQVLKRPLRLASLTLDPVWLLLSVHSSMRIYIALDRSPLQFTQFCRRSVFTTSYNLGHTLSMHYLSGAIFGAGWVVSSLELIGSPGGFARTLGTGLRDFVSLPYHGILEGPWGFLVGVTHGSASLMKHFTAGTLTSVTKMASSVARNLDRLTLDAEHLERTEELRRMRPQGVAEGLLQGLTGLGISLLGAVGGLAHHPLQSMLSGEASPKGLVTGVGRGLVGVFTKPLSGAADLVAMTGQGLLQGAGWSHLPKPKNQAKSERTKLQRSALIKYSCKIQHANIPHCLLVLEATLESSPSRFKAVTLMLTPQNLIVLSADGDNIESSLLLSEIILPESEADATMLTISFKGAPPLVDQRMWDFVNGCRYVVNTGPPALETSEDVRPVSPVPLTTTLPLSMQTMEHQSAPEVEDANPNLNLSRCSSDDGGVSLSAVQPAETTAATTARPPIVFHVNPQLQSHFIVLIKVAQRQMQGQGFQVL